MNISERTKSYYLKRKQNQIILAKKPIPQMSAQRLKGRLKILQFVRSYLINLKKAHRENYPEIEDISFEEIDNEYTVL